MLKTDFEYRKVMWLFLSDIFDNDDTAVAFVWLFSEEDKREASQFPDGVAGCAGYYKGTADGL
jgi:hypothetical protein